MVEQNPQHINQEPEATPIETPDPLPAANTTQDTDAPYSPMEQTNDNILALPKPGSPRPSDERTRRQRWLGWGKY